MSIKKLFKNQIEANNNIPPTILYFFMKKNGILDVYKATYEDILKGDLIKDENYKKKNNLVLITKKLPYLKNK